MFILYSLQAHTGNSGIKALLRHGGGAGDGVSQKGAMMCWKRSGLLIPVCDFSFIFPGCIVLEPSLHFELCFLLKLFLAELQ